MQDAITVTDGEVFHLILYDIIFVIFIGILLFVLVGYRLTIKLLTRNKRFKRKKIEKPVTVIIPTYNEERVMEQKLKNIFNTNYPRKLLDVIICDSNSTDRTIEIVKKFPVKILKINQPGKIKAINIGIRKSKTDLVLLTDADVILDKNAISNAISVLNGNIGAVNAMMKMRRIKSWYMKGKLMYHNIEWNIRHQESLLHSCSGLDGKFILFDKKIMKEIPENAYVDDFEMAFQIIKKGYRCILDNQTIVYEIPPANLKEEIKQLRRRAKLSILTVFRHLDTLFNPKYSYFGILILPSRRIFPNFLPFILIYIIFFIFIKIGLFTFLFLLLLINKSIFYFMILMISVVLSWFDILSGRYSRGATWKSKIN